MESIDQAGFTKASQIQELTIEPILSGKDIFAQAETGSGKTAAFVIPILEQILRDEKTGKIAAHETRYAVLCPTRELAQQTYKVFQSFGKELSISSCCVIGGESIGKQKEIIGEGVHVLIATPGRFADLIKQKVVGLDHCKGVVFDEADRLFDMGFQKDIEFILSKTAPDRQLIMLSATSNQEVLRTAYKFNSHPEELRLNEDSLIVDHLDHKLAMVTTKEKFPLLVQMLRKKEDAYAIVFCNTQFQTHLVAEWLLVMGFKAKPISGRLAQNRRTKLMEEFRAKEVTILVCTDVAARGLDIKNVNLVINYDLPQEAANYVHRIGRTGRAGEAGEAISFCAHEDCEYLDPIYELIDAKIEKIDLEDSDFATDICKKPYIDRKTLRVSSPGSDKMDKKPRQNSNEKGRSREKQVSKVEAKPTRPAQTNASPNTSNELEDPVLKTGKFSKSDKRFFEVQSTDIKVANAKALSYFRIEDETLLAHEVIKQGKRKFLIFGPRQTEYKFYLKPIYKKILLPYLINILKKSGINLFVKVSFRPTSLLITFSGKDDNLLTKNKFELLRAFEYLIKNYLHSKIVTHKNLTIQVKCLGANDRNSRNRDVEKGNQGLIKFVEQMKKKVLETQAPVKLKPLNASDRRLVHLHFEKDDQIQTSSVGEGRFKQVELALR